MIALLFPGQGTQKIGMLTAFVSAFSCAKCTLEEIEDATSLKILSLTENSSLEELSKTENAQLAVFTFGMLCLSILKHEYGFDLKSECKYLAGHSLGEYTALCASGVFSLYDSAKLVKKRGELMAAACKKPENLLMSAVLGVTVAEVESVLDKFQTENCVNGICVIANDNSSTQVVLSGHKETVQFMIKQIMNEYPRVRSIDLNTSGAFHSPLMSSVAIALDEYFAKEVIPINDFSVPVISNVTVTAMTNKNIVCDELIKQVISRVRWRETIDLICADNEINTVVEVSPNHILSNMIKRDYASQAVINLDTINQIEEFMKRQE